MVKRLFIATLVAISPLYALAQGLITGHIKDARSGEALIGASVIVKSESGKGVVTDADASLKSSSKTPRQSNQLLRLSPKAWSITSAKRVRQVPTVFISPVRVTTWRSSAVVCLLMFSSRTTVNSVT